MFVDEIVSEWLKEMEWEAFLPEWLQLPFPYADHQFTLIAHSHIGWKYMTIIE